MIRITLVMALVVGCSATIIPLRPSANAPPLGLPRAAWLLCYDTIQQELRHQANTNRFSSFSDVEQQCLETYLLDACGRFLREYGIINKLWKQGETRAPFYLFEEYMRLFGDRCEDRGGDTEAVRRAVQAFDEQLRREMTLCPTRCEPGH